MYADLHSPLYRGRDAGVHVCAHARMRKQAPSRSAALEAPAQASPALNSNGKAYIASLFDASGTVRFKVSDDGGIVASIRVTSDQPPLLRAVKDAFGGVLSESETRWDVRGEEAKVFAQTIRHFSGQPLLLEAFLAGLRLIGISGKVRTDKGWRSLPLSARHKERRRAIQEQIRNLQSDGSKTFNMPRAFLVKHSPETR